MTLGAGLRRNKARALCLISWTETLSQVISTTSVLIPQGGKEP